MQIGVIGLGRMGGNISRRLIEHKDATGAQSALSATFSVIDRSARWGIIKKNTAARYKSRLQARLKAIAAA